MRTVVPGAPRSARIALVNTPSRRGPTESAGPNDETVMSSIRSTVHPGSTPALRAALPLSARHTTTPASSTRSARPAVPNAAALAGASPDGSRLCRQQGKMRLANPRQHVVDHRAKGAVGLGSDSSWQQLSPNLRPVEPGDSTPLERHADGTPRGIERRDGQRRIHHTVPRIPPCGDAMRCAQRRTRSDRWIRHRQRQRNGQCNRRRFDGEHYVARNGRASAPSDGSRMFVRAVKTSVSTRTSNSSARSRCGRTRPELCASSHGSP